ncbi:aspartic peptidase domain-containing protein [Amylostereum chailletii]|nr:aspartic peptidase domain-containing protein [Amylostereum chailletii]
MDNVLSHTLQRNHPMTIPLVRTPKLHQRSSSIQERGDVQVASIRGYSYLARISAGNQILQVIFDTGSSDLWVISSDCTSADCDGVAKYKPSSSLNQTDQTFKLNYLHGSVSGLIGFETVAFGPFQVSSQALAIANATDGLSLPNIGASGILGLSFPNTAALPSTVGKTLLENIFAYFDDAHRFFAFKLDRTSAASSLSIGELDPAITNSTAGFVYSPVYIGPTSAPDYWKLPMHAIVVNGSATFSSFPPSRVSGSPTPIAVLDTGTTFILGPSGDVDALWNAVGASRKTAEGQWEVQCSRAVSVGFILGDDANKKEYVVDPADMSWAGDNLSDGWCTGGIQASNSVNAGDWILGDTFLRNVYVTHHGATTDKPPLIGLLNLTDASSALQRFQTERGHDPNTPISIKQIVSPHTRSAPLSPGVVCGMVLVVAFIVGGAIAWLVLVFRGRSQRGEAIEYKA